MRGSTTAITDALEAARRTDRHATLLQVLDILLSALIIGPAVVAYWRGTWMLMDIYIYPDNFEYSSWVSLVIGLAGHFIFTLLQGPMTRVFSPDTHRLTYYVVSRGYTTVFGVVCVNAWRGAWSVLDVYAGKDVESVVATTVISVIALAALKALTNLSAPPFAVIIDAVNGYFAVPTMFNLSKSSDTTFYVLDVLFSVLIVGNLVVFVWRGAWLFVDIFLFPSDPALSAWASLFFGYVVVALSFTLQPAMKRVCSSLTGFLRLLAADTYLLFSFVGTINVWRGVWNLLNVYFLPESPSLSNWLTHSLCLFFLMLLNCSNSILVRGVLIDGSRDGGECVIYPCTYLQLFVQSKRDLKRERKGQHMVTMTTSKWKLEGDNKKAASALSEASNHVHLQLLPTTTGDESEVQQEQ